MDRDRRTAAETPVPAHFPGGREGARGADPRRTSLLRTFLPLSAAAAVIFASWLLARPTEMWTVLEVSDASRDDGQPIDEGDRFLFATVVTSAIGSADVQLGRTLRIAASPGTRMDLPPGPGRRLGRTRLLRIEDGEIYVTTAGRPLDFDLVVASPETRTHVRGATFAIRCNELGTCVSVWDGRIETESADEGFAAMVPVGSRVQFFAAGLPPETAPLRDEERERLKALRDGGLAPLRRSPP